MTIPHMRGSDPRDEFDEIRFAELGMSGSELLEIAVRLRGEIESENSGLRSWV